MANYTLSYSPFSDGWTSFHSYSPQSMVYLNNNFYTFNGGKLYKHYDNDTRGNYYGKQYDATITTVLNDSPTEAKMFKTIELNSNKPWLTEVTTNLSSGKIESVDYALKEGDYYAYIRRLSTDTNLSLMSAQGVGSVTNVSGTFPGAITLTFDFDIDSIISIGDKLYRSDNTSSTIQLIGTVTSRTDKTLSVTTSSMTPVAGNFILYLKDAQAESYGSRGYYMDLKLTYKQSDEVELFSLSSEIFKSFP